MSDTDLCFTPALDLAARIASREVSSVEAIDAVISRVESLEPSLNAFATFVPETARAAAQAADIALARTGPIGPLHGVPMTIKDLADVQGLPTERGSLTAKGQIAPQDAPFVARLRAAGAICLGKTTTSEYGWKGVSHSPLTGITSNPWRLGYNAGASSAGAGVGAAAGYGPLHQGSDGAGSIRLPAHFCGVYGLKPTFGRVPNVPVRNNDQSSHIGPITRTVADAALMLRIMAGAHPLDHYSLERPPADYPLLLSHATGNLKVAFSSDLGHARVDADVAALVREAANAFEELGATVEEVAPGFGPDGPEIARFFWTAHELELTHFLSEYEDQMDTGLVACIRAAESATAAEYLQMRARKHDYVAAIHGFFERYDLLLTPAASVPAFPAEQLMPDTWPRHPWDWLSWAEFSYPFNLSGNPAATLPAGFTKSGLPVGLQVVGRRFDDLGVLRASAAYERLRPWQQYRPSIA